LYDADVQTKLKLSDDQKQKVKTLQDQETERMRSLAGNFGQRNRGEGNRPNVNFEEIRAQGQKTESDLLAVLTDEQKKEFESMKGKAFTFPERRFGAPGGEGRRGNGQRRPNADNN
jgi:hypothetical protein